MRGHIESVSVVFFQVRKFVARGALRLKHVIGVGRRRRVALVNANYAAARAQAEQIALLHRKCARYRLIIVAGLKVKLSNAQYGQNVFIYGRVSLHKVSASSCRYRWPTIGACLIESQYLLYFFMIITLTL